MDEFALGNDQTMLLQGRDKANISSGGFPTKPKSRLKGGIRNNIGYNGSRIIKDFCGNGNIYSQLQEKETVAPTSTEASLFPADENLGIFNVVDNHDARQFPYADMPSSEGSTILTQDEHNDKGTDLFYLDWPKLGDVEDIYAMSRNFGSTFELGSSCVEELPWSSMCSPGVGAQLVPGSCIFDQSNSATVLNENPTIPALTSSGPVTGTACTEPASVEQINMINPVEAQQTSTIHMHFEKHACSTSSEFDQFSQHSDADLLCLFGDLTNTRTISSCDGLGAIVSSNQDTLVPTTSSMMCEDENVCSSTCREPNLAAADIPHPMKNLHAPFSETPDMILDEMAENPLQKYFPALPSTNDQSEMLMSATSIQKHQCPEDFQGKDVLNCANLQFYSKRMTPPALYENPRTSVILEAVPVKDLGFQKLQEGVNQLDARTKMCIRDALYRLANCVEQRHCVASTANSVNHFTIGAVESSGIKGFTSSKSTKMQTNPMDHSVVKLLLQKPSSRTTSFLHLPAQTNHVT